MQLGRFQNNGKYFIFRCPDKFREYATFMEKTRNAHNVSVVAALLYEVRSRKNFFPQTAEKSYDRRNYKLQVQFNL
jgi:hypothetical protein